MLSDLPKVKKSNRKKNRFHWSLLCVFGGVAARPHVALSGACRVKTRPGVQHYFWEASPTSTGMLQSGQGPPCGSGKVLVFAQAVHLLRLEGCCQAVYLWRSTQVVAYGMASGCVPGSAYSPGGPNDAPILPPTMLVTHVCVCHGDLHGVVGSDPWSPNGANDRWSWTRSCNMMGPHPLSHEKLPW